MSGTLIYMQGKFQGLWSICKRVQGKAGLRWGLATSSSTELMDGVVCMLHNADCPVGTKVWLGETSNSKSKRVLG